MSVASEDQPLEVLREQTIDRLIVNYGHGHLSLEAFQRRLDLAFDAEANAPLQELTRDLVVEVDEGYVATKRQELTTEPFTDYDDDSVRDVEYMIHIFGGGDRTGEWTPAREIRIVTIFGGCNVDFSEARFGCRTTTVRLFCLFGGVDLFVPEGLNATVNTFCIFGGVNNKAPNHGGPDAPRLEVEGVVMFGGADVKMRKTLKQRVVEFADSVRELFSPTGVDRSG